MSLTENQFLQRQGQFWDDISTKWSLANKNPVVGWYDSHNNFPYYQTHLFRGIPNLKSKTVLEVGCGPARNMILFRDWFAQFDGVDIAEGCIEKARVNLAAEGVPIPNLWVIDGRSLPMIGDASYDIVMMVISHQHITSRAVRMNLYREYVRVLKPGGYFVFQTGYGPGHPRSVDYFADTHNTEADFVDKDVRVENLDHLKADLETCGFEWLDAVLTDTCHDEHPQWAWVRVVKP